MRLVRHGIKGLGIVLVLLFAGVFAGVEVPPEINVNGSDEDVMTFTFNFNENDVEFVRKGEYVRIDCGDNFNYIVREGYPMLPYKVEVIKLPFGTKIEGIEIKNVESVKDKIDGKIIPAPSVAPDSLGERIEGKIYSLEKPYPSNWISYHIGAGIDGKEHVIYLVLHVYPLRYTPAKNEVEYLSSITVEINYRMPEKSMLNKDEYDLLIIAPDSWMDELQPLKEHKEQHGIKTIIVGLDEIYGGKYFAVQGRDDAEKIKYFIKNAIEEWGIEYVMLVGGRQGGVFKERWLMPVRYSYLDDGGEAKFLSDLYFADIYKYEDGEIVFEDWDSNGNGIYGEWHMRGKDMLDLYPDVYLGRLACRNVWEVKIMVDKIIEYELNAYGSEWAKRFVGIAGDTYPGEDDPYFEGELATKAAFDLLNGYEARFVWTSTGNLSSAQDIIDAISEGCGFLHFSGHGNPMSWANHPPHDEETWIGIDVLQFYKFSNKGMYPITIIGGCHNNQFNVSVFNLLKLKHLKTIYYKSEWSPECFGWWLARKIGGGSIATVANTGYGYGIPGEDCLTGRGRYMEIHFFKSVADGKETLGEVHASDLTYYLNAFPPMEDRIDTKIVEQWALLGDPSLMIGGYPE
ncbi:MAG: peptidase C25 [Thermoplasmata archaeon]|nr:peptidase C25 [Thermoplasmata archaeon]